MNNQEWTIDAAIAHISEDEAEAVAQWKMTKDDAKQAVTELTLGVAGWDDMADGYKWAWSVEMLEHFWMERGPKFDECWEISARDSIHKTPTTINMKPLTKEQWNLVVDRELRDEVCTEDEAAELRAEAETK
jgi:hypothetical protein